MNLGFLAPTALWGLVALAVPLIIHLISKRRARRVRFALVELLLRSQKRTARNIRLRQLLLLLLRTLLLACAALAFARPILMQEVAPQRTTAPLAVVVVLDASASMHAHAATLTGKSVFERARAIALDVVRDQPHDVRTGAILCGADARDLAAPTFDRGAVVGALDTARAGFAWASLPRCVERAASMARAVEGEGERRVVVVSDLAAHAFVGERTTADGAGVVVEWRPAGDDPAPPNHAVAAADAEKVATRVGASLAVGFDAVSYGASAEVDADLFLADARAARISMQLDDARSVRKTFHVPLPDAAGATDAPGTASVTELSVVVPKDALDIDDVITLPIDSGGALEVLIVDGAPQALPFQDEVFYLSNALENVRGGRARLKTTTVGPEQLTPAAIAGARVVVLANVARLDDAVAAALVEHVRAGAGLFITMGDQVDVEWTNAAFAAVLPAPLRGSKGQALLDDASVAEVLSLSRLRTDHPILAGLGGVGDQADVPGLSRVRTHTLMLVEPRAENDAGTLARFSNGAPALVEREVDAGRSLILLTSVDRDWSDLAIRPGFVPLVQQAVLYLGGALEDPGPRLLHVGDAKKVRVPRGAVEIVVTKPGGATKALKPADADRDVTFTDTDVLGLYHVSARNDGGALRELQSERFSVAIDPRESDLRRAPPDVLASSVPRGAISRGASDDDGTVRLWPFLLIAAAALLLLEALVVRRSVT